MNKSTTGQQVRQQFLQFFDNKQHRVVPSAPLLPANDPTLLFVNAGMVPFKDLFLGKQKRPYSRATSVQKCVRAGGKHNDLENVGRTARHHTFFEMLGNFSFGDYFKQEACVYAWEFFTQLLRLDPKRLHVTVFGGQQGLCAADMQTQQIWQDVVGVPAQQIQQCGAADNFWSMGETGPCGPCTEIHYDRRDLCSGSFGDDPEGDGMVELWNLVFMQYERHADGSLTDLPRPCVDTGMGLERLCTVLQQANSNYDTDLLQPLLQQAQQQSGRVYKASDSDDDVSLRVLADHSRCVAFLIADGVMPANEGRGYVLRRILRRAVRHGEQLGLNKPFLHELCGQVVALNAAAYPELLQAQALVQQVVLQEEEAFRRTLQRGLQLFATQVKQLPKGNTQLPGDVVFRLHETYGFPPDLTAVLAREQGLHIDWDGFAVAKQQHNEASASQLGLQGVQTIYKDLALEFGATPFVEQPQDCPTARVLALLDAQGSSVACLTQNQRGIAVLHRTPFYGESGGQAGDIGVVADSNNNKAQVVDTQKVAGLHLHHVHVQQGQLTVNQQLRCSIDQQRRQGLRHHHSATHLLHSALRQVLGTHVTQKGSLVQDARLRFDFSHFAPLTPQQLQQIQQRVNSWIQHNDAAQAAHMSLNEAKQQGALALFGEKYGDSVRVIRLGKNSLELCGGTHVQRTGDIGSLMIVSDSPVSAGVRRIEAVSGSAAVQHAWQQQQEILTLAQLLSVSPADAASRLRNLLQQQRQLQHQLTQLQNQQASQQASQTVQQARDINGVQTICQQLADGIDMHALRSQCDAIRQQLGSALVVLASTQPDNSWKIVVALTKDLQPQYHAGKLAAALATAAGGRGGGRPDFAQAGGPDSTKLKQALQQLPQLLQQQS
ncbi:MAG: alanine--tRNA ligase [Myxococcota bacterium]